MASSGRAPIQQRFPSLLPGEYEIVCPDEDPTYNCVTWAAGVNDAWWEPSTNQQYYWPDHAPNDDRIGTLVLVFKGLGYSEWDGENDAFEEGFEKVAIYGKGGAFEHAARQLPEKRKWTSKLGPDELIEHNNLQGLAGELYGTVVKVLRRPIPPHLLPQPPQQGGKRPPDQAEGGEQKGQREADSPAPSTSEPSPPTTAPGHTE